jgi:RimJ/RimL family protein N-acetyltransferase
LYLRPACQSDVGIYYQWVNDEEVRKQSISSKAIPWSDHKKWFHKKILGKTCRMFVLMAGKLPVGQIRFDLTNKNRSAEIDYSLDCLVRGRGWAVEMIKLAVHEMKADNGWKIVARVKKRNQESIKTLERAGFERVENVTDESKLVTFAM